MLIQIPADLSVVTLRASGQELLQRWSEAFARSVLRGASDLLRARAEIAFYLGESETVVEEMPTGTQATVVDEGGYHYLAAAHKARRGVRVLFVDRLSRPEVGGQAREPTRVCVIAYETDTLSVSRMLAHELGHLLGLAHAHSPEGPGHERAAAVRARNLMNAGALHPDAELTPAQVQQARSSRLARDFGGR
ncbi:MAG TPA: hypothetical protein VNN80_30060 [Polyangiaceae bacterium]|jgi:hypothetical protein|nr:hypothetical protein [Polyangiaceae bacterium]